MTTLNRAIFNNIRESMDPEAYELAMQLIDELPQLEAFRQTSQGMGDKGELVIRLPSPDESMRNAAANFRAGDDVTRPSTIRITLDSLQGGAYPGDVLQWVCEIAHEHQHYLNAEHKKDAIDKLAEARDSNDKSRQLAAASDYIEVAADDEMLANMVRWSIRHESGIMDKPAYATYRWENSIDHAVTAAKAERPDATDLEIAQACRGEMLRYKGGAYLENFLNYVSKFIPGLDQQDLQQLREQMLDRYPRNPQLDRVREVELKGTDKPPLNVQMDTPADILVADRSASDKTAIHLTPEQARVISQIRDCCRAPHNEGRFDRLSSEQQDNLVAALLPGAMRWAGNPDLATKDVGRVVMTEKGFTAVEMGPRNLPGAMLKTDEAIQQPVEQSLALVDQQQQRQLALAGHGHGGPTHSL